MFDFSFSLANLSHAFIICTALETIISLQTETLRTTKVNKK